jgi:hypothetical protein
MSAIITKKKYKYIKTKICFFFLKEKKRRKKEKKEKGKRRGSSPGTPTTLFVLQDYDPSSLFFLLLFSLCQTLTRNQSHT